MMDHYCRNCFHMTESIGVGQCQWCHSGNIGNTHGASGSMITPQRHGLGRPQVPEPDVYTQINYPDKFRLIKGFHILHGGDI